MQDNQQPAPAQPAPAAPAINIHELLGEKPPAPAAPSASPQTPAPAAPPAAAEPAKSPAEPEGAAGQQKDDEAANAVLDRLLGKVTEESAARSENLALKQKLSEASAIQQKYDELQARFDALRNDPIAFIKANPDINWDAVIDHQLGFGGGGGDAADPQQPKAAIPDELTNAVKEIKARMDEQQKQQQQKQQNDQQQQVAQYWNTVSATLSNSTDYPLTKKLGSQADMGQLLEQYAEVNKRIPTDTELLGLAEKYYSAMRQQYIDAGSSDQPGLSNRAVADTPTPAPSTNPQGVAGLDDEADFLRVLKSIG